jgi:hypothetical protein
LVFPLVAYFDAGANYPSPSRLSQPLLHTVGCYVARYNHWQMFRKEWRRELDKKRVSFFHMKDFEYALLAIKRGERDKISRKNPFKHLNEEEFVPLLRRVHGVINRKTPNGNYRMAMFASSVVKADFDQTCPTELKGDPECKSYYILNVANIMKMIALWFSQQAIYDPIHYVFAGGDGEGGNVEKWFRFCWNSSQDKGYYRLNKEFTRTGYNIEEMAAEPAIQAADIAAYEFNKVAQEVAQRGNLDIPLAKLRKSLPSLGRAPHYSLTLTKENLPGAFAQISLRRKSTGVP